MAMVDNNAYIVVKDAKGQRYLCPIGACHKDSSEGPEAFDDCVEEEVVWRCAGNITKKPS